MRSVDGPLPDELVDWLDPTVMTTMLQEAISSQDPAIRDRIVDAGIGHTRMLPFDEKGFTVFTVELDGYEPKAIMSMHWSRMVEPATLAAWLACKPPFEDDRPMPGQYL